MLRSDLLFTLSSPRTFPVVLDGRAKPGNNNKGKIAAHQRGPE
jgi:hypothetical protein